MTNEEAIFELRCIADEMPSMECADWLEAISMAIKLLEQQPCEDCISIEEAIEVIAGADETDGNEPVFSGKQVIKMLKGLPPVTPRNNTTELNRVLDKIITQIEQARDKDKLCEYPYNRCINIIKEEIKNENNSNG